MPGLILLDLFFGVDNASLTTFMALAAFGLLGVTIGGARASDTERTARSYSIAIMNG
jgi:hypothetical protein